ncbi:MAG: DNA polymerase I [Clostridiales bacterium]|nr:DNA polymerase I [Clostridiales bacterium]
MKKIFIIDGNSLINRAFYALPLLTNSNGIYTNAVFGFVNIIVKLITENKPDYMVVAFDHARKTFRNQMFEAYKGTRKETPQELRTQFATLKEILQAMNIFIYEQEGIEADDIIGTIAKNSGLENYIITGDRDSLQLIDANTKVWLTQRGITDIKEVSLENIKDLYGMTPSQVIDYKALSGDSSDNIPGVAGIGDKTALNFLEKYGNIDGVYQHLSEQTPKMQEKLLAGKEMCYLSYKLATIKTDCDFEIDINQYKYDFPFSFKAKELCEKYEFTSLLKRTTLFADKPAETVCETNNVFLTDENQIKQALSEFKGSYFAFDIQKDFTFSFDDRNFIVKKDEFDFVNKLFYYDIIKNAINPILSDANVLKIITDIKANLHILGNLPINNVFDLSLAEYLTSGGYKPEQRHDASTFYALYQEQLQKLKQNGLEKLYYDIELPLVYVLYDMEKQGFKIDKQALMELQIAYSNEMKQLEQKFDELSGFANVNIKSPKQLAKLLFEDLKLSDKGNKKHSTNVDSLALIESDHPIVPIILRHRKVAKLFSTYIEPYANMLKVDSVIHTIFNQMQTSTGRLSSSEPNLQNIPVRSEEGKGLRKLFVSSFDGGCLVSADYNQIELRLLANFSNDKKLLEDYSKGTDIHRLTASQIFGVDASNVTDLQRRMAKAVNFGIIYGISGFGLSKNIDISVKDAKRYIDIYFEKYPQVKQYLDGLIDYCKQTGHSKTLFGRIRKVPEISSSNGLQKMLGERIAMNMPLQGSASDLIKIAMLNVYNRIKKENIKSKLILQIHDELIIDTYPGEEQIVKQLLKQEMENVYNFVVPLIVSVSSGKTWYDCK